MSREIMDYGGYNNISLFHSDLTSIVRDTAGLQFPHIAAYLVD